MELSLRHETLVAVAGDWHANTGWAQHAISSISQEKPGIQTILHMGDFGLHPDHRGLTYLTAIDLACEQAGITRVLVTPGNHENWTWLDALFEAMPGLPVAVSRKVSVLPRGFRFTLGGKRFLSFGGAASIDYALRSTSEWWLTEIPTEAETEAAISGGPADVLLTHEVVNGGTNATEMLLSRNPRGWSSEALAYSAESRERVSRLWAAVAPPLLLHGHMHTPDAIELADGRRVISLGRDDQANNVGYLDLRTLRWDWANGIQARPRVRRTRDVEGLYLTRPPESSP